jgi:hypothetical protein
LDQFFFLFIFLLLDMVHLSHYRIPTQTCCLFYDSEISFVITCLDI